ncbi:MAG: hypothetical protein K0R39_4368 [Symbiobacteriaceae bacterium]|jgi:hypothetical protein|nr:hypothetical protein [Symbiobacteriaceae bacterium]
MHPVERLTVACGLALFGLGAVAASYMMGSAAPALTAVSLVSTLAVTLNPAGRLEYLCEPDGLRIGKMFLPFADMVGARIVRLDGTWLYRGVPWPGCWSGKAWSPRLGRFELRGSTGLGQGVMFTMADGHRIVITPANPVGLVVHVHLAMRGARGGGRRVSRGC